MDMEQLRGLLSAGPDEAEQRMAKMQGLLGLGIGLLQGSRGNYGAFAPALAQGLQGGLQNYNGAVQQGTRDRRNKAQEAMALMGLQGQMDQRQMAQDAAKRQQEALANRQRILGRVNQPASTAFNPGMAPPVFSPQDAERELLASGDSAGMDMLRKAFPRPTMERFETVDAQGRPITSVRPVNPGEALDVAKYQAPSLTNLPVPGQPGVTQPTWLTPGSTQGTAVGGMNMPDILNPVVQEARKKVAAAGASRTTNNLVNAGPKAFDVEIAKLDAKQLDAYRDSAEQARSVLATVQQLRDAEQLGTFSGGGAETKVAIGNFINGLTGITIPGVVGSQQYNAAAYNAALAKIRLLGANPSNTDLAFIQKTIPQLGTSPEARTAMAEYMERAANTQIETYRRADAYARERRTLGGFDGAPPPRPAPAPEAPGTPPPRVGEVRDGYRYNGGNPASQMSWTKQ